MTVMKAKNKKMKREMKKKRKKQGTMLGTMVVLTVLHPLVTMVAMTTPALLGYISRIHMKKMLHNGVAGVNGNIQVGRLNVNFTSHITKLRKNFLHPLHIKLTLQSCWR